MTDEGDKDKIPVMEWTRYGVDPSEPVLVYRVDDPEAGKRFFQHLNDNAKCDGGERFEFKVYSQARWNEVTQNTEQAAGS